jgi:hypothetical protein
MVYLERGRPSGNPHPCRPTMWRSPKAKQRERGRRAGSTGNSPRLGRNFVIKLLYCLHSLSGKPETPLSSLSLSLERVPERPWLAGLTSASSRLRSALVPGGCVTMHPVLQSSTTRTECAVCHRRTRTATIRARPFRGRVRGPLVQRNSS